VPEFFGRQDLDGLPRHRHRQRLGRSVVLSASPRIRVFTSWAPRF